MDHVGGFDYFFRCLSNRESKPNHIWGPIGTTDIVHHRIQEFLWNLHSEMSGTWRVHDVSQDDVSTSRFELCEASATKHYEGICEISVNLFVLDSCTIEAHVMNHGTPSLAYVVRERAKWNADTSRLAVMGLRPWPVLKQLKNSADTSDTLAIDSLAHSMATLRGSLVTEIRGHSIAYLTGFILDEEAVSAFLVHWRNAARSYAKHSIEIQTALLLCENSICLRGGCKLGRTVRH